VTRDINNNNNTKKMKYVNYLEAGGMIIWRFLKFWTCFRKFPHILTLPL